MVRGAPLVKESHSTSQNRWARTSPRSTFVLQTVRWCTPPPSNRLICWDEVTFFTLQKVLFVVGFCWFRLEILPVFVAPPWSEVWQSLSFAENCLAWLRGFNLRGSCLLIFELLFPSSILVDYELWIQVVALAAQLSLPNEQPSSSSTICPRF